MLVNALALVNDFTLPRKEIKAISRGLLPTKKNLVTLRLLILLLSNIPMSKYLFKVHSINIRKTSLDVVLQDVFVDLEELLAHKDL